MYHYSPRHLRRGIAESPLVFYLFFPVAILYLELIPRIFCLKMFWGIGLLYILLFSVPAGLLCALLSSLWSRKINTVVSFVLLGLLTFVCYGQTLYYTIFKTFMTLYSFTGAGEAAAYWKEALAGVWASFIPLLLMLLPLVFWILIGKKTIPERRQNWLPYLLLAAGIVLFQTAGTLAAVKNDNGIISPRTLYTESFVPNLSAAHFGILTTLRLDIKNLTGGMQEVLPAETEPDPVVVLPAPEEEPDAAPPEEEPEPIVYGDNVMEIDFDSLIASETDETLLSMHKYFSSLTPTKQNEYTGLWKGKNLIWRCAEGFSCYAVDQNLTPTLYKLANEGFVFENFYNPIWGVSTSDGEYTTCTGLIPKSGVWSFSRSGDIAMPF
jgi:phosphoglycerol transferase MdoB-like AlkP superfamily enzyme